MYCRLDATVPILRIWRDEGAELWQDFRLSRRAMNSLQRLLDRGQDHGWGNQFEILIYTYWLAHGLSYRVRKLEVFKEDLQGECANLQEVQGERDQTPFVDFVDKLIVNFSKRFDSFSFGQQLTLFIQNPFLITDMRGFTQEVKQLFSPDLKPWQEKLELISHTEQER
ncbi:unnamed protein product [Boreogadus saida]